MPARAKGRNRFKSLAMGEAIRRKDQAARRPLRSDGEATRARIIEAAGRLFAGQGFAATTSKEIAATAGVDIASINYHFGSRTGLYEEVLLEAHGRIIRLDRMEEVAGTGSSGEDKLRRLIGFFVDAALGNPGWPLHVLAREILAPSSHVEVLRERAILPKMSVMLSVLAEITGLPREDPALLRALLSVLAPCLTLVLTSQGPTPLPIRDNLVSMGREALVDHLVCFSLAGLAAVSARAG